MANEGNDRHEGLVTEAQAKAEALKAGEGYFYSVRTTSRLQGDGSGWDHSEKLEDHILKVGEFRTAPAKVLVSKGLTINLGEYQSARVTIGVELPCYIEEIGEVTDAAEQMVEARVENEVLAIKRKDIRPGYEGRRQEKVDKAPEAEKAPETDKAKDTDRDAVVPV